MVSPPSSFFRNFSHSGQHLIEFLFRTERARQFRRVLLRGAEERTRATVGLTSAYNLTSFHARRSSNGIFFLHHALRFATEFRDGRVPQGGTERLGKHV